jgi:hypothetical protein
MNNRDRTIPIASGFLILFGLVTLLLSLVFSPSIADALLPIAVAILLIVAGFLLYKRLKLSILILAISALLYLLGGIQEANANNISLLALIPAFFWSFAFRVVLVFITSYLLFGWPFANAKR